MHNGGGELLNQSPTGMGYEDEKKWKENQKKLKEKAELLKKGGKVEMKQQKTRQDQDKKITVHMVPHSHDDAGWVKTVDEYYTGANSNSAHVSTRNILDTVV